MPHFSHAHFAAQETGHDRSQLVVIARGSKKGKGTCGTKHVLQQARLINVELGKDVRVGGRVYRIAWRRYLGDAVQVITSNAQS